MAMVTSISSNNNRIQHRCRRRLEQELRWLEFMERLFTEDDLDVMASVRMAFNPRGSCSPGKMLPTAGACGMEHIERSHPGKQAAS